MKEPVLLPFFFLFSFLCALVIFAALDVFGAWGLAAGATPFTAASALAAFPRSALHSLVPAVVTALFLSGMRMARRPFSRFLGLVICLAVGYLLLVNGMILLGRLESGRRQAATVGVPYFPARSFVQVGGRVLSADRVAGDSLRGVLAYNGAGGAERLTVYPDGRLAAAAGGFAVQLGGARPLTLIQRLEPPLGPLFRPDRFTELFLRDIAVVTADLQSLRSRSLAEFFASCFSLLFLWAAMLAVLRFTRWPLLNLLVLALAVRGSFWLYHELSVTLAPQLSSLVTDVSVARLVPAAALAAAGVVFLLVDILFIPADRWTQGEAL